MHQIASRLDFHSLSPKQQQATADVLNTCGTHGLSCRCEMLGNRDFTITIAPGLSSAKYWKDRFDID